MWIKDRLVLKSFICYLKALCGAAPYWSPYSSCWSRNHQPVPRAISLPSPWFAGRATELSLQLRRGKVGNVLTDSRSYEQIGSRPASPSISSTSCSQQFHPKRGKKVEGRIWLTVLNKAPRGTAYTWPSSPLFILVWRCLRQSSLPHF